MSNEVQADILKTSGELFYKFGIRSVSIDDICKALGISKKTFYVYYPTKDDLVSALLESNLQKMQGAFVCFLKKPLIEFIRGVGERQMKSKDDIRRVPQLVYDLQKYYPQELNDFQTRLFVAQQEILQQLLQKGIDEGLFRQEIDVKMTAMIISKMHSDSIRDAERLEQNNISMARLGRTSVDLILRGLVTADGYRQIYGNEK